MRLSIVIPVYNVEKYIAECLESVLNQGMRNEDYEVIIVIDGSTDDSFKIAQSYAKANDHINIIEKENGGLSSARNCGLDHAKGEYIYFLDSDDYLLPNSLCQLVDTCELHNLDILTFVSRSFSLLPLRNELISKKMNLEVSSADKPFSSIVTGENYVATLKYRSEAWSYLTKREFLVNSGIRFEEGRYLEDVIFSIKLFLEAKRMAHLKLDSHRYRIASGSIMTGKKPSHYNKVIRDMQHAVLGFEPVLKTLENKNANPDCIARVKERQQSVLFFSMIRMFKSTMSFNEVKLRMTEMMSTNAYPLNSFTRKDYNGINYKILSTLFRTKHRFYFFFLLINPILKIRNRFSHGV